MKSIIRGVAAPLATFAVLIAGAPIASAAEIGESQTATAEALPLSSPVHMAPQPPELSPDEKRAVADYEAGRNYDRKAYKSARQKINEAEKYKGKRNKQKRGK